MTHGDCHNFGKVVRFEQGYYLKPRTVVWEEMFLSSYSIFRTFVHDKFLKTYEASPFDIMPTLEFSRSQLGEGRVSAFEPYALWEGCLNCEESYRIGMLLGKLTWVGVDDLHSENMIVGRSGIGHLQVCPVDIESLLQEFRLPSQTLLLPSPHIKRSHCGFSDLLNSFDSRPNNVAALCTGYSNALDLFQHHAATVAERIAMHTLNQSSPIRLIFRPTSVYNRYLRNGFLPEDQPAFFTEELVQLQRGDIPYFFRFPEERGVKFYAEPRRYSQVCSETQSISNVLGQALVLDDLSQERKSSLQMAGILQIVRTLMHVSDDLGEWQGNTVFLGPNCAQASIGHFQIRTPLRANLASNS